MEVFEKYVQKFSLSDEMIKRKYQHSIRVSGLARLLASKLKMTEREIEIASLCGLYHDIGRFLQAKKYHSFLDNKTLDHGDLGHKVFLDNIASKEELTAREESIIAKAIMYHNKLKVPSSLTDNQKIYLYLTRDADKIDIFFQLAHSKKLEEDDEEVSIEVLKLFQEEKSIPHDLVQNKTDKIVLMLAFIFDINYNETLKIIKDHHYLENIQDKLDKEKYAKYFQIINKYIKERLKC